MQAASLPLLVSFGMLVIAVVAKGWLFLSVVQAGLRERRVPVDEGRLALRGGFGRQARIYLALLDEEERRLPGNRWVARLQWLLPLLAMLLVASAIFYSWQTGR